MTVNAANMGHDAIAELLEFLRRLTEVELRQLAQRRGIAWAPVPAGSATERLHELASRLSYQPLVVKALQELSRRELSLLRLLLSRSGEIAQVGMARYFAPVLSREALQQALARLQSLALVLPSGDQGAVYVPDFVRSALIGRSALPRPAALLLRTLKNDALQQICLNLGLSPSGNTRGRSQAIQAYLSDEPKVRASIAALGEPERKVLTFVAASGGQIDPWTLSQRLPNSIARGSYGNFVMSPTGTALAGAAPPTLTLTLLALMLPVPGQWPTQFVVPDEVLVALQPEVQLSAELFEEPSLAPAPDAQPAGTLPTPVLDVAEAIRYVIEQSPSLTQRGLFAKPDSKRLSRRLSTPDTNYADLLFDLTLRLNLTSRRGSALSLGPSWEKWLDSPELAQRADLFNCWLENGEWFDDADEPYPRGSAGSPAIPRRRAALDVVGTLPPEGASLESIALRMEFEHPGLFELSTLNSGDGAVPAGSLPWARGVLRLLAWLGLAEPLVRPGTPGAPPTTTGMRLTVPGRALLQNDETAEAAANVPRTDRIVVQPTLELLAPPNISPLLYFGLRMLAEPVTARGVRTLQLTSASLRSALDAGTSLDQLRRLLADHSDAALPNTVEQLLTDVGNQHGRVRAGIAGYYIVVDQPALLEEIQADPRLTRLISKVLAPTVALVKADSLDAVIAALRAAGHMPVADAATVSGRAGVGLHLVGAAARQEGPAAPRAGQWVSGLEQVIAVCEEAMDAGVQAEIVYMTRSAGEEILTEHRIEVFSMDGGRISAYD